MPLEVELRLMDDLAIKYLKTYQVWHHRRLLVTEMRTPAPELQFVARCLKEDAKNYHTWSYRQWILAFFNDDDLWETELDFVEQMINDDVRNNSAWHHRFFVVFLSGIHQGEQDRERVIKRELMCVHGLMRQAMDLLGQLCQAKHLVGSEQRICMELPTWCARS